MQGWRDATHSEVESMEIVTSTITVAGTTSSATFVAVAASLVEKILKRALSRRY